MTSTVAVEAWQFWTYLGVMSFFYVLVLIK